MSALLVHFAGGGLWAVRKRGAARAKRRFPSQAAALRYARAIAAGAAISVHGRDGLVLRRIAGGGA